MKTDLFIFLESFFFNFEGFFFFKGTPALSLSLSPTLLKLPHQLEKHTELAPSRCGVSSGW